MRYDTPQALRTALEQRLLNRANGEGLSLDRLRRQVLFQRVVVRLQRAEPGRWVLKGGMAMEVRLGDDARLTKDIDLGLRDETPDGADLRDRLIEALGDDADADGFTFAVGEAQRMAEDGGGHLTWRVTVTAGLAGRLFGSIKLDVSPRAHELNDTEIVALPNALAFAGVRTIEIEIVDVSRHAAEKLHGMQKDFGDRENSRVRDLLDVMLFDENDLLDLSRLRIAVIDVWREREDAPPPRSLPPLPAGWKDPYERMAEEYAVEPRSFPKAVAVVSGLWTQMFDTEEH